MTAFPKIVIGLLATSAVAAYLNGPGGLGAKCAAGSAAVANTAFPSIPGAGALGASGTSGANPAANAPAGGNATATQAAASCQDAVTKATQGNTINFTTGGSTLASGSAAVLDQLAGALKNCPKASVEVAGHTDAQGDAGANQALSQRRADAVLQGLVQRGVARDRLVARGYGETRPLDSTGPENNPRNRRIEFTVSASPQTV